jgi:hypothetical protein
MNCPAYHHHQQKTVVLESIIKLDYIHVDLLFLFFNIAFLFWLPNYMSLMQNISRSYSTHSNEKKRNIMWKSGYELFLMEMVLCSGLGWS